MQATVAHISAVASIFVDRGGNLYIADTSNSVIRFVYSQDNSVASSRGLIFTLVGSTSASTTLHGALPPGSPVSGFISSSETGDRTSTVVLPYEPRGVNVDKNGNIYIADTGNGYVWKFAITWHYDAGCTDQVNGVKCCDWDSYWYSCYYFNNRYSYSNYYGGSTEPPSWTYCPCDKSYPVVDLGNKTPLVSSRDRPPYRGVNSFCHTVIHAVILSFVLSPQLSM